MFVYLKLIRLPSNVINRYLLVQIRNKKKEAFRKPIWAPTAPSKLFRIPEKPNYDEEERAQREYLDITYNRMSASIYKYFKEEFYLPTLGAGGFSPEQIRGEEEEQMKLIRENDIENERVRKIREERLENERKEIEAELLVEKLKQEENRKILAKQIDEEVEQEIKRSETYITKETLDQAIEEALENVVNYEFAIDVQGNIYYDDKLHPYALMPSAIPETSSNTKEFVDRDKIRIKLEPKPLY